MIVTISKGFHNLVDPVNPVYLFVLPAARSRRRSKQCQNHLRERVVVFFKLESGLAFSRPLTQAFKTMSEPPA